MLFIWKTSESRIFWWLITYPWLCINPKEGSSQIISLTASVSLEYLLSSELTSTVLATPYASIVDLAIYTHLMVILSFIFLIQKSIQHHINEKETSPLQSTYWDEASHSGKLYWGQKTTKTFNNIEKLLTTVTEKFSWIFQPDHFLSFQQQQSCSVNVMKNWRQLCFHDYISDCIVLYLSGH